MNVKRAHEVAESLATAFADVVIDASKEECVVRARQHNRWPLHNRYLGRFKPKYRRRQLRPRK